MHAILAEAEKKDGMDRTGPPSPSTLVWGRRLVFVAIFLETVGLMLLTASVVVAPKGQGYIRLPEGPVRITLACFSLGYALSGVCYLLGLEQPGSIYQAFAVTLRRAGVTPRQHHATMAFATFCVSAFLAVCACFPLFFTPTYAFFLAVYLPVVLVWFAPLVVVRLWARGRRPR
jgi:hypothetical protein